MNNKINISHISSNIQFVLGDECEKNKVGIIIYSKDNKFFFDSNYTKRMSNEEVEALLLRGAVVSKDGKYYKPSSFNANGVSFSDAVVNPEDIEVDLSGYATKDDLNGYVTNVTGNANQIVFDDGETFQNKLDQGELMGPKGPKGDKGDTGSQGPKGADGLTTTIKVNGNTYTHNNGTITLPNYPSLNGYATESYVKSEIANAQLSGEGGEVDLSAYQMKNDNTLITSDKTIVGAINEIANAQLSGEDGSTTSIQVNGNTYTHNDGIITLPNYPSLNGYATESYVKSEIANAQLSGEGGEVDLSAYQMKNDQTLNTTNKTIVGAINEINGKVGTSTGTGNVAFELTDNSVSISHLDETIKMINGVNILDPAKIMRGIISSSTGKYDVSDTYITIDYIEIEPSKTYKIVCPKDNAITVHGIAYYDENKTFISYGQTTSPENAKYLRIRSTSGVSDERFGTLQIMIYEYKGVNLEYIPFGGYVINDDVLPITSVDKFEGIENGKIKNELIPWESFTKENLEFMNDIKTYDTTIVDNASPNLVDPRLIMKGDIDTKDGSFKENGSLDVSDFIEIKPSTQYLCNMVTYGIGWYDENKQFIEYTGMAYHEPYTSKENAKYIRLRINPTYTATAMFYEYKGEKLEYIPYDKWQIKNSIMDESLMYIKDFLKNNGYLNDGALAGLKWYVMGDSISCSTDSGYQGYVSRNLGLVRVEKARMGNHMTYNNEDADRWGIVHELETFDMADADIITILIGTNDWANYPLGDLNKDNFDKTTFFGAMNTSCKYLVEHWIGKRIGFMTPPKRDIRTYSEEMHTKFENLVNGMITVCGWYSIPILNLWTEGGLASDNDVVKAQLIPDGLHPNTYGHAVLARPIEQFLKRL